MELARIDSCPERDKYVVIIMDEMQVREDIVYDKHTGMYIHDIVYIYTYCVQGMCIMHESMHMYNFVFAYNNDQLQEGFSDLGDLNNHLLEFEKTVEENNEEKEAVAKSMMVIMVRGLFTKLQFAYAQFPCASVCGYHLYDIF